MRSLSDLQKLVAGKSRVSASDYNKLVDVVNQFTRTRTSNGMTDAAGILTRNTMPIQNQERVWVKNTTTQAWTKNQFVELTKYNDETATYEGCLPTEEGINSGKLAILEDDAPVNSWAIGYTAGIRQLTVVSGVQEGDLVATQVGTGIAKKPDKGGTHVVLWVDPTDPTNTFAKPVTGGGGGATHIYGIIVDTPHRANPLNTGAPAASEVYKVKLVTDQTFTAWSKEHGAYEVGEIVSYNYVPTGEGGASAEPKNGTYICLVDHESHETRAPYGAPASGNYWQDVNEMTAGVIHCRTPLSQTTPWYRLGEQVDMVFTKREGDGTACWWIIGTVANTTYWDKGTQIYRFSQMWNAEQNRQMAVFA